MDIGAFQGQQDEAAEPTALTEDTEAGTAVTADAPGGEAVRKTRTSRLGVIGGTVALGLLMIGAGVGIGAGIWSGRSSSNAVAASTNAAPSTASPAAAASGPSTAGPSGLDVIRVFNSGPGKTSVTCPPGHPYVTGGGGQDNAGGILIVDAPNTVTQPNGWVVMPANAPDYVVAFALCSK